MSFNIHEEKNNVIVIECPEGLRSDLSESLRILLSDQIKKNKYKIVIELSQTKYIDSSGLGAIVSQIATTRSNKGDIRIASAGESIEQLLQITHLNKIIKCYKNYPDAVQSFEKTDL